MTVTEVSADWVLVPESVTAFATSRDEVRRGIAEQLYRELAPAVLGYLRSQRAPDPEDVLGEVFLHVARDAHRCRGDTDGRRQWVFTIAHRRLVDAWRRRAARPQVVDGPVPERSTLDVGTTIIDDELQDALDALTDDQRTVVLLRFVADLPLRDVARITGRRVGAVKALQHRGLDELQRALDRTG
jgi:RNA polymerase sigma factor (sigma-70 family)